MLRAQPFMQRRSFLTTVLAVLSPGAAIAHSPWGQYAVYRQKHLLVLSTRDDPPSYPSSKLLVAAINQGAPDASARPARARDLQRAYELLRSDQFQFALLSPSNIAAMRQGTGPFVGRPGIKLEKLYQFDTLEFVVRSDFPVSLAAIVTEAVLNHRHTLPNAATPQEMLNQSGLHPGARAATEEVVAHGG